MSKLTFPVTLYHKDHDVYVASGYPTYPIVVATQEEYDGLAPGWQEDPKAAAAWTEGQNAVDEEENEERDETDDMLDEEEHGDEEVDDEKDSADDMPKKKKKSRARK